MAEYIIAVLSCVVAVVAVIGQYRPQNGRQRSCCGITIPGIVLIGLAFGILIATFVHLNNDARDKLGTDTQLKALGEDLGESALKLRQAPADDGSSDNVDVLKKKLAELQQRMEDVAKELEVISPKVIRIPRAARTREELF